MSEGRVKILIRDLLVLMKDRLELVWSLYWSELRPTRILVLQFIDLYTQYMYIFSQI